MRPTGIDALQPVVIALVELEDKELRALVTAANEMMDVAAGFLSWVEHLANWELDRRAGLVSPLQPPKANIPPEEDAKRIAAALMMKEQIADRAEAQPFAELFDAVLGALTRSESPE